ncbi:rab-GTPase-TBC domain-containing protein [Schizophyllum amplum]|uniref:Rab-GTPase-TBC domain-containing protein n=1 Tax=Schizophyllum amplum TaxID=97359 RepID=A0A550BZB5_9AGAR|nr:rab-GTPase-TBC domain-containing protein [Auriculariopsis ampla]
MSTDAPKPEFEEKAPISLDEDLRALSLEPGGFGARRAELWPKLLGAKPFEERVTKEDEVSHPDERQIRLDTDRSFVMYPVDPSDDKAPLQEELHRLIVSIFRKRRKLNYFQGYHDIISVLFLTLPEEVCLSTAEKMSLHRLRDSMGASLEPTLGLLRVTRNLLRVCDPPYADLLERNAPLPFYALSNLLTLFAHDIPTLPLIQHVFDYLLCREPLAVVYLCAAVLLSRKDEVHWLEQEDEEGMMHSLLSSLPDITDGEESQVLVGDDIKISAKDEDTYLPLEADADEYSPSDVVYPKYEAVADDGDATAEAAIPLPPSPSPKLRKLAHEPSSERQSSASQGPPRPTLSLTSLLQSSDALYAQYPPTHPGLRLASIMGPQSVVFTWNDRIPDDDAEKMVERTDLVVYPNLDEEEAMADAAKANDARTKESDRNKRRPRRKLHKRFRLRDRRVVMVAGAVLVLGVAMAVYGQKQGGRGGLLDMLRDSESRRHWMQLGGWVGGAVVGIGGRLRGLGDLW